MSLFPPRCRFLYTDSQSLSFFYEQCQRLLFKCKRHAERHYSLGS
jgi:hypothetical protein